MFNTSIYVTRGLFLLGPPHFAYMEWRPLYSSDWIRGKSTMIPQIIQSYSIKMKLTKLEKYNDRKYNIKILEENIGNYNWYENTLQGGENCTYNNRNEWKDLREYLGREWGNIKCWLDRSKADSKCSIIRGPRRYEFQAPISFKCKHSYRFLKSWMHSIQVSSKRLRISDSLTLDEMLENLRKDSIWIKILFL